MRKQMVIGGAILAALCGSCTRSEPTPSAPPSASIAANAAPKATAPVPPLPSGAPEVLAEPERSPLEVAVLDGILYFVTNASDGKGSRVGDIWRLPASGGTPEPLVKNQRNPHSLKIAGGFVYWLAGSAETGAVMRMPMKGGAPAKIAPIRIYPDGVLTVDVDATYWLDVDKLVRARHATGKSETVTKIAPLNAILPTLALGADRAFWASNGVLFGAKLDGSPPYEVTKGIDNAAGIVADSVGIFWTDRGPGSGRGQIMKVLITPPTLERIAELKPPWGIAMDETFVYVAGNQGHTIVRALKTVPRSAQVIVTDTRYPRDIAVDNSAIYWTTERAVMRLAK